MRNKFYSLTLIMLFLLSNFVAAQWNFDLPAKWNTDVNQVKSIPYNSPDGTIVYSNIKQYCVDPEGIYNSNTLYYSVSSSNNYDLYYDGNDLKIKNIDTSYTFQHGSDVITIGCSQDNINYDYQSFTLQFTKTLNNKKLTFNSVSCVSPVDGGEQASCDINFNFGGNPIKAVNTLLYFENNNNYELVGSCISDSNGNCKIDYIVPKVSTDGNYNLKLKASVVYQNLPYLADDYYLSIFANKYNQPPVFLSQPNNPEYVLVGLEYNYYAFANDPEGLPIIYSLKNAPSGMTIDQNGVIKYQTNASDLNKVYLFSVEATDGVKTSSQVINLKIINNKPSLELINNQTATPNKEFILYLYGSDLDNQQLFYKLLSGPSGMQLIDNKITWTPSLSDLGSHSVVVELSDGYESVTQTFNVEVLNNAPVIISTPSTTAVEGLKYNYQLTAKDPENDTLSFILLDGPSGMTINPVTGLLTWDNPIFGKYSVKIEVNDAKNGRDEQLYLLDVQKDVIPDLELSTNGGGKLPVDIQFTCTPSNLNPPYVLEINFGDGNKKLFNFDTIQSVIVTHRYEKLPLFSPYCSVIDIDNDVATKNFDLNVVENIAPSPLLTISKTDLMENEEFTLNTFGSKDLDGKIISYIIDFGDGNKIYSTESKEFRYSYNKKGNYKITLTVEDDNGKKSSTSITVNVMSKDINIIKLPDSVLLNPVKLSDINYLNSLDTNVINLKEDEQVNLMGLVSTSDTLFSSFGKNLAFMWDFDGDGIFDKYSYPQQIDYKTYFEKTSYVYKQPGIYSLTLKVVDNFEDEAILTKKVIVSDQPLKNSRKKIKLNKINLINDVLNPSDSIVLNINIENNDNFDIRNAYITLFVPELGLRKKVGPFRVNANDVETKSIKLELPEYVEKGEYTAQITIGNENGLKRKTYRSFIVN